MIAAKVAPSPDYTHCVLYQCFRYLRPNGRRLYCMYHSCCHVCMKATDSMTWAQALLHSGPETRVHLEGRVVAYIHLFRLNTG